MKRTWTIVGILLSFVLSAQGQTDEIHLLKAENQMLQDQVKLLKVELMKLKVKNIELLGELERRQGESVSRAATKSVLRSKSKPKPNWSLDPEKNWRVGSKSIVFSGNPLQQTCYATRLENLHPLPRQFAISMDVVCKNVAEAGFGLNSGFQMSTHGRTKDGKYSLLLVVNGNDIKFFVNGKPRDCYFQRSKPPRSGVIRLRLGVSLTKNSKPHSVTFANIKWTLPGKKGGQESFSLLPQPGKERPLVSKLPPAALLSLELAKWRLSPDTGWKIEGEKLVFSGNPAGIEPQAVYLGKQVSGDLFFVSMTIACQDVDMVGFGFGRNHFYGAFRPENRKTYELALFADRNEVRCVLNGQPLRCGYRPHKRGNLVLGLRFTGNKPHTAIFTSIRYGTLDQAKKLLGKK